MSHLDHILDTRSNRIADLESQLAEAKKESARYKAALENYGAHDSNCILSFWSAGEPTPDGGYRTMYKGKWYQTRPVDETPKCECGLEQALQGEK